MKEEKKQQKETQPYLGMKGTYSFTSFTFVAFFPSHAW